jgi:hypothetical protein
LSLYLAFSDEAGIADNGGEFLVAGYVAHETEWPWITRAWQERVLDGPPKIPYLHMTEIRSRGWREKNSISYNESEERVAEAVRVLQSSGPLVAVASVMKRSDLHEAIHTRYVSRKKVPKGVDEPDYACFLKFVGLMLIQVHDRYRDARRVDFIVSRKETVAKGLGDMIETTKLYLADAHPEIASLLGELIPASMEAELPLQAADVLCWHLQRYYTGTFDRTDENRMWMLLKERDGELRTWTKEELETVGKGLEHLADPKNLVPAKAANP